MSKMPDQLMGGRIIVKVLPSKEEKIDSLIIPATVNATLSEGLVVMVDPQISEFVKVGNILIFPTGSGVGQYIGNDPHLWLEIRDIWGGFEMDKEDA